MHGSHNSSVHKYDVQMCEVCSKEFKNWTHLKSHVDRTHGSGGFECKDCKNEFKSKHHLNLHITRKHKKSYLSCICKICQKEYTNDYGLERHMNKYHKSKRPKTTRSRKSQFVKGKADEGVYCEECDKTYTTKRIFNLHQTIKHVWQPTSCKLCSYTTRNLFKLRQHYTHRHQVTKAEAKVVVPAPERISYENGAGATRIFKGKRKPCNRCGKTYDLGTFSKHRKKCEEELPIEQILARATVEPKPDVNHVEEQKRIREDKVKMWRMMQTEKQQGANKSLRTALAKSDGEHNSVDEVGMPSETFTKSEVKIPGDGIFDKSDGGTVTETLNTFKVEIECGATSEKVTDVKLTERKQVHGYSESLNLTQSKAELANQLGLSYAVFRQLTRDEILESLHEAMLSEPSDYEAGLGSFCDKSDTDSGSDNHIVSSFADQIKTDQVEDAQEQQINELGSNDIDTKDVDKDRKDTRPAEQEVSEQFDDGPLETSSTESLPKQGPNIDNSDLTKFTCNHNTKRYKKEAKLKKHLLLCDISSGNDKSRRREKRLYSCDHCKEQFSVKKVFLKHLSKLHKNQDDARKFICDICTNIYKRQGDLENHRYVKHSVDEASSLLQDAKICSVCSKSLRNMQSLKWHISNIHTKQEESICPHCGKHFKDKRCLSNHVNNVHTITNEKCGKCQKMCKNKPALEKHMKYNH